MRGANKTYVGKRLEEGCEVYVVDDTGRQYPLPPHYDIRNHSPDGFEWGYGGSGPAQLALAILADHFGPSSPPDRCPFCECSMDEDDGWKCKTEGCGYDGEREGDKWKSIQGGVVHYQDFKQDFVASVPKYGFQIGSAEIEAWAKRRYAQKEEAARPVKEIQRAHDALVAVIVGDIPVRLTQEQSKILRVAADVLCWVLMHDHNRTFEKNLDALFAELRELGFELMDHGN